MRTPPKKILIAGIDEAGRGPLAGPVMAAAVILHPDKPIEGLRDSKQLTPKEREALYEIIIERALTYGIGRAEVSEIDRVNILQATFLAMQRAVNALKWYPMLALIDGNQSPSLLCTVKMIVRGDETEPAISAASVLAKVTRDREMVLLDKEYPHYQFAKHKGYPTRDHLAALEQHGPCFIHRRYYGPVARLLSKACP